MPFPTTHTIPPSIPIPTTPQVNQASRQGSVGDYLVITRYERLQGGGGLLPGGSSRGGGADAPSPVPSAATGGSYVIQAAATAGTSSVRVKQRVAAFLTPQDALYFDAGGSAIALYDYEYLLTRVDDDS